MPHSCVVCRQFSALRSVATDCCGGDGGREGNGREGGKVECCSFFVGCPRDGWKAEGAAEMNAFMLDVVISPKKYLTPLLPADTLIPDLRRDFVDALLELLRFWVVCVDIFEVL